jgi:hypothetical protein
VNAKVGVVKTWILCTTRSTVLLVNLQYVKLWLLLRPHIEIQDDPAIVMIPTTQTARDDDLEWSSLTAADWR